MKYQYLTLATLPLALAACGPKANDTTPEPNAVAANGDAMLAPVADSNTAATADGSDTSMTGAASGAPDFVKAVAMSDMYEIESSKLARAQATSPEVKEFANQMIAEHNATTMALMTAYKSDGVSVTLPAALDAKHKALVDALKGKKGAEFDTLYTAQQRDSHATAKGVLQGFAADGGNSSLRQFAKDTVPKVQGHLDMLKDM